MYSKKIKKFITRLLRSQDLWLFYSKVNANQVSHLRLSYAVKTTYLDQHYVSTSTQNHESHKIRDSECWSKFNAGRNLLFSLGTSAKSCLWLLDKMDIRCLFTKLKIWESEFWKFRKLKRSLLQSYSINLFNRLDSNLPNLRLLIISLFSS